MPICLRSQPSCHVSLKLAGYSNLLNEDILKMPNLKLSQHGVLNRVFPGGGTPMSSMSILITAVPLPP